MCGGISFQCSISGPGSVSGSGSGSFWPGVCDVGSCLHFAKLRLLLRMCEGEALKNLQYTDPILYILLFFNFLKLHFFYYGKIVTEYCNFFKLFLLLLLLLLLLYGGSLKKKKEILNIGIYAIFSEAYRAFFTDFKIASDRQRVKTSTVLIPERYQTASANTLARANPNQTPISSAPFRETQTEPI